MAISTTGSQVLYTGTNSPNQVCPFPYIFFANTDLEVVTLDASNVSRTLVLGTDYSVTGANNTLGGSVTLFAAVPTTTRISVVRNNPETQLVSLTTGDRFPASIMERALDKLTMLCQELGRAVSKTLRVADVSSSQPVLNPLPTSVITTDTSNQFQFSSTSSATGTAPFFLAATTRGGQPTFQSIPTGAIGSTQIADGAVGSIQLATGSVGETQLATGAVTSDKLASGAVGSTQLADASVTSAKIATGAVGTTQIADASVTTSKLADSFVTTNTRQTITGEKVIQLLYETTSNSTIPSTAGNRSFVVGTGLNWVAGSQIQLLVRNTTSLWLRGSVVSYDSSTGAMTASITTSNIGGSTSYNDWIVTQRPGTALPALRITANDSPHVFLVEDSTNPDSTPFTISSTGRVGIGIAPDTTACLSLDTTGVKFGDGTIQTTAGGGGGGGVSSVGGTAPISSSGGTTPTISITAASTTGSGAVQLTDSTTSTSITTAATPNSVKTAFDLASGKVSKTGDTMTGSLNILAPVQVGDFDPTYDGSRIQINPSNIDLQNGAGIIWGGIGYPQAQDSLRNDIRAAGTGVSNTFTSNQIVSTTSTNTALRVTQLGGGEAFRVEDESPESTPFVISSTGRVGIGTTPDSSVGLKLDSTGVKFDDGTIQTTASSGGGGGGTPANVQVFSTIGAFTWTKPLNAKSVHIALISGGGGGGSGQRSAASSPASGGGGGGGGARNSVILSASLLGNSENGNVGAGGAGGASVTSVGNGNNGQPGSASNFGLWAYADRGGNGSGGTSGNGGSAGSGGGRAIYTGGTGANGSATGAGTNAGSSAVAGGGGGGGGGTSGVSAGTGGTGGLSTLYNGSLSAPAAGANGPDVPTGTPLNASGGGGGSASFTAPAMAGGNGGFYGAGGGGGGGGSGFASGKGGNGSQGIVVVTTYF
jgi:hypothetical protein